MAAPRTGPARGVVGMTQLNGNTYTVTVIDADHYSIGVDTTGFGAYVSGGTAGGNIFTLITPYAAADLPTLKFVQSQDTMTLTHPSYGPRQLSRSGHAAWTLTTITFAPQTPAPGNLAASSPGSTVSIVVTAISDSTGEESLPSSSAGSTSSSDAWTWTAVSGCTNYNVYKKSGSIFGFVAQVQTNGWTDANLAGDVGNTPPGQRNPFGGGVATGATIVAGGSAYSAPTGKLLDGGRLVTTVSFGLTGGVITSATLASTTQKASLNAIIQVSDGGGSGAALQLNFVDDGTGSGEYAIGSVTVLAGGSGYHANAYATVIQPGGSADGAALSLTVAGGAITAATVTNPGYGFHADAFPYAVVADSAGSGGIVNPVITDDGSSDPACSTYYLQRQVYAGTRSFPQTLWFSGVGAFNNMNVSQPTKDSDAITRALTSREVNEIRHLVPAGNNMLVMTSGAEWRCYPGASAPALTPGTCTTLPQTTYGCSHVPPIWDDNSLLFVQERGSRVRELRFDVLQDQYQSSDMSVLSQHLLYDSGAQYTIQEWAFAEEPFRVIWCVRSDGTLLGFTYMKEHQVYAWHRHTTDGVVESVCSIPETDGAALLDAVYLIVNRTINGVAHRYVERMVARQFATIADAWFVDCGLQYSGAPVTQVTGLTHLIGKTVAMLGDGSVIPSAVVDNSGAVQLDGSYSKVTVGLPYTSDLETLNLELPAGGTVQGQMKKIAQVTLRVKDARGITVGLNQAPSTGSGQAALAEVKQRSSETLGSVMQPFNGDWAVAIPSEWNRDGRLFVRQSYPLPVTILDLIPEVNPFRDGGPLARS